MADGCLLSPHGRFKLFLERERERASTLFRGPFFFIADLYVMYHKCRYFIRCTMTQRRKNLNCLFVLCFLAFLTYVWPFCLYSIPLWGPLNSGYMTNQTLHLFCVCVRACVRYMHALQRAPRPFLLSVLQLIVKLMYIVTIAFCQQHFLC